MKLPIVKRKDYEDAIAEFIAWKIRAETAEKRVEVLETLITDCLHIKIDDHILNAEVLRHNKLAAQSNAVR